MHRIAICDDNNIHLEYIYEKVMEFINKRNMYYIVKKFNSGFDLLTEIDNLKLYDIYILDIEMPNFSGINITKVIKELDDEAIIIFITSHIQYVFDSYNYSVFRFIPKCEIDQRIDCALTAALQIIDCQSNEFYYINNNRRYEKFAYKDIVYIYKQGKNSVFVLINREVKERKNLNDIYNYSLNAEDFEFVDKCYIINIQMIISINYANAEIKLKYGNNLKVSKSRINDLREKINIYWGKKI